MAGADPDPLDGLFHGCALAAFLEQARREQGWPDSAATRRLAYRLYEDALAAENADRPPAAARGGHAGVGVTPVPGHSAGRPIPTTAA